MGVISDYKEAENIEDIVKVFVIKQRISNLLSDSKNKNYEDIENSSMILSSDEMNNLEISNEESLPHKEGNNNKPIFNVRGFN